MVRNASMRQRMLAAGTAAAVMIAAAFLPCSASEGGASSPELTLAKDRVASAAERFAEAGTYRIEFTQENHWSLADTVYVADGTLTLVRPSRLSIRYTDGGRVSADGESLRVFVPQTNQFFVTESRPEDLMIDPAMLLSEYEPDEADPLVGTADGGSVLVVRLRPRGAYSEPARLHVSIDTDTAALKTIEAFSTSGDRTVYLIHSIDFGAEVDPGEFKLAAPPGAERIVGTPFSAE